jgi:hypothetical protein
VPFSYYTRLSPQDQRIYRESDRITSIALARPDLLRPFVDALRTALEYDKRKEVEAACGYLARGLTDMLGVVGVEIEVLAVRPSASWGELHGLYTPAGRRPARIQLWMRTARHKRVVAFKAFLRTLLHEVGHHLDYHYLKLADSFHTEGFFKRESSLFHQLVPTPPRGPSESVAE